jgi:very-short-patch-repair endonuclease
MKIKGLDGKLHTWSLTNHVPLKDATRPRSELHKQVRELLLELYPIERILEEVPLPGSGGLSADFYIPGSKLIVEAHGRQHYEFVQMFHRDMFGFIEHKKRDKRKREWAEINNITVVELPYNEDINEWRKRILHRTN